MAFTCFLLKAALVAYFAVGIYTCQWGIKASRSVDIQDEETKMLLLILALASITLWPLFFIMEDVRIDNPFTKMAMKYIKAFKAALAAE
jgi:hypothetical protein